MENSKNCSVEGLFEEEVWWKKATFYQIYVRSFKDSNGDGIGDINGIREKLPYLKYLGIDAIYLNPINTSPNDDNGYDISDYYNIMEEFGTLQDFKNLIKEARNLDIRVCMDIVLNHSSCEHPWFLEAKKSKESPYHDYYIFKEGKDGKEPNNWLSFFGGPAWEYNEETNEYYLHIFSKKMPDFNYTSPKLRKEVKKIISFWKNFGVDGIRLDAINHLAKDMTFKNAEILKDGSNLFIKHIQNLPKCHEYIRELREDIYSKEFPLMGEAGGLSFKDSKNFTGPALKELDFIFHFDYHSLGLDYENSKRKPYDLIKEFKLPFFGWSNLKDEEGWNPLFWSNHDTTRTLSRLSFNDRNLGKVLALLQFTMRGTPFIYYGDEIGMTDGDFNSIEDFRDVGCLNRYKIEVLDGKVKYDDYLKRVKLTNRDNSRTPMQWNKGSNGGFSTGRPWIKVNSNKDTINVEDEIKDENSILNFYKKLISLRRGNPLLIFGKTKELFHEDSRIVAYQRYDNEGSINKAFLIIANFSNDDITVDLSDIVIDFIDYKPLLSNKEGDNNISSNGLIRIKAYQGTLYKRG